MIESCFFIYSFIVVEIVLFVEILLINFFKVFIFFGFLENEYIMKGRSFFWCLDYKYLILVYKGKYFELYFRLRSL